MFEANLTGTRAAKNFDEPFTAKLYRTRTISWLGPRLWNSIISPKFPHIAAVPASKHIIKKITKTHFLEAY